ncbi:MAG TPA: hypothetical protein VIH35_09470, partial [Kiritimatiellia bacterium]
RGEDKILGHFLAIASGKVPADSWDKHDMSEEEKYGYSYFLHGWQGGGLFMQYICGLFADDRGTKLGHSAANFAWAQMVHAIKIGAPVWAGRPASARTNATAAWAAWRTKSSRRMPPSSRSTCSRAR